MMSNLTLKIDSFDGFVNQSSNADYVITKTSFHQIFNRAITHDLHIPCT